jgi:hypothetical protein
MMARFFGRVFDHDDKVWYARDFVSAIEELYPESIVPEVLLMGSFGQVASRQEFLQLQRNFEWFYSRFSDAQIDEINNQAKTIKSERAQNRHNIQFSKEQKYVYLIQSGLLFKIGITKNLDTRLSTIKTHTNAPVELIHSIKTEMALELERELHQRFNTVRSHGEWFSLTTEHVNEILSIDQWPKVD